MNDNKNQLLLQCYHCGNKTLMNVECEVSKSFGGVKVNENLELESELQEDFKWNLAVCPVCNFPTLYQIYTNEAMITEKSNGDLKQLYEYQIIYPENKMMLSEVPKNVARAFNSALKIKKIDREVCLIALRRTIEQICIDKNAKGRTLKAKIWNLESRNIFPKDLKDSFTVIREYGNDGAHSSAELSDYQLDELIRILYSVINYLYVIPKKSAKMKEQLDEKKCVKQRTNLIKK